MAAEVSAAISEPGSLSSIFRTVLGVFIFSGLTQHEWSCTGSPTFIPTSNIINCLPLDATIAFETLFPIIVNILARIHCYSSHPLIQHGGQSYYEKIILQFDGQLWAEIEFIQLENAMINLIGCLERCILNIYNQRTCYLFMPRSACRA